ncbi:MAG: sigma-70 family RNA polymerase sigma factor [Bacteroidales bacterium]|nr:sigma-70 family RNA polymerase sigma factor [Bacteroidales bacterium]
MIKTNQLRIKKQITNRDEDISLEKYLKDISKYPLLSIEEEVQLAQRIKAGDEDAVNRLVEGNLRFVVSVAKQYVGFGVKLIDLIDEGNVGLIKAARRFDETRGIKFISMAVWWIRQQILSAISVQPRLIRLPINRANAIRKKDKVVAQLEQELQRTPTTAEIADAMNLREDEVKDLHMDSFHQQSLDAPIAATDGESNLYDILPSQDYHTPEMELAKIMLHQQMDNLLDTLPETEANILRLQFGLNCEVPMTIIEISNQLDMSEKDVQRLSGKALRRLRNNPSCEMMRTYLQ